MGWFVGIMTPVFISFMFWVGSTLVELKVVTESTKTKNEYDKAQIDTNTKKIEVLAIDVNKNKERIIVLETKN